MASVYFQGDDLSILMSGSQNMCDDAPNLRNCASCSTTYPDRSHDCQNSVTGSKSCSSPSPTIAIGHYCQSCAPASRATCFCTCLGSRAVANWVDLTPRTTVQSCSGKEFLVLPDKDLATDRKLAHVYVIPRDTNGQPCSHAAMQRGELGGRYREEGLCRSLRVCNISWRMEANVTAGQTGENYATPLPTFDVNPFPHVPAPMCERRSWRAVRRARRPASRRALM